MKINSLDIDYSKKVTDRFLQLCGEGKISYQDELRFFQYIKNRYKPVTISDYSKLKNRNYKLIQEDFDKKKLSGIELGHKKFIYSEFN